MKQTPGKWVSIRLNMANADVLGLHSFWMHRFENSNTVWDIQKYVAGKISFRPSEIKLWHDKYTLERDWKVEEFWEDPPLNFNVNILCMHCDLLVTEAKDLKMSRDPGSEYENASCEICDEAQVLLEEVKGLMNFTYDQRAPALQALRLARNVVRMAKGERTVERWASDSLNTNPNVFF